MSSSSLHTAVLVQHPAMTNRFVNSVSVRISVRQDRMFEFSFSLEGNLAGLRVPSFSSPRRGDRLWEHTCFEVFVAVKGDPFYCEFNFSPSGEWAAYAFSGYRKNVPLSAEVPVSAIAARHTGAGLELDACVPLFSLPLKHDGVLLKIGCSAVIEAQHGELSYWALKHPPGKPDFHHPDAFLLELPCPQAKAVQTLNMTSAQ